MDDLVEVLNESNEQRNSRERKKIPNNFQNEDKKCDFRTTNDVDEMKRIQFYEHLRNALLRMLSIYIYWYTSKLVCGKWMAVFLISVVPPHTKCLHTRLTARMLKLNEGL